MKKGTSKAYAQEKKKKLRIARMALRSALISSCLAAMISYLDAMIF
ncbi:hypothetical protein A2U01_0106609 [Trifolium medium]|uniref:Uncharacterized protein n=1 Tax=Trifolium medium TaxID=97028 RepID=A0A392VG14_9FABA|nr:hypothetical protein [Trifolium medium]